MKICTLVALFSAASAFAPTVKHAGAIVTELRMGFFEDLFNKPIHGHGSGEKKLGAIYKEEQDLLKDRREHYRKDQLKKKYSAKKKNSWIDDMLSHPFHAQGSSHNEEEFDDMYKAQQQLLYERREYYGNRDMLKKKYAKSKNHLQDIPVHQYDPAVLNKKEDDAMWIDENAPTFKFPNFKLKP
jgi:hypothetical protein